MKEVLENEEWQGSIVRLEPCPGREHIEGRETMREHFRESERIQGEEGESSALLEEETKNDQKCCKMRCAHGE